MSRIGRLSIRHALTILSTVSSLGLAGCENASLIGTMNVSLGGSPLAPALDSPDEPAPSNEGEKINTAPLPWPDSSRFRADMKAHGYSSQDPAWAGAADWLELLKAVCQQHPGCPTAPK